jgi:cob(I)alamin adenosyltransferase
MPRITKIYTRTGDDGTTALGGGQRVPKSSLRIEVFGTVDEVNAVLGTALASGCGEDVARMIERIQNELFHLGSDLCFLERDKEKVGVPEIEGRHVEALEDDIERLSATLDPLENFILPGGSASAAALHLARTVCRRAERLAVELAGQEKVGAWVLRYLNRLSDLLFVAARAENHRQGIPDVLWDSRS